MRPITINITNLIGVVIINDKEADANKIESIVQKALCDVLTKVQNLDNEELCQDKTLLQSKDLESQD